MNTYDYLVRKINNHGTKLIKGRGFDSAAPVLKENIEEEYVRDCTSAEGAVISFAGESVIITSACGGMYFFEGVNSNNKYVAIQIRKVYIVSTGKDCQIQDIRSDKETAQVFMEQFPDEKGFNNIEEVIIDDPRTLNLKVPDNKSIFYIILNSDLTKLIHKQKVEKDFYHMTSVGKINKDKVTGKYQVYVIAGGDVEAIEEAKKLCQQYKEIERV